MENTPETLTHFEQDFLQSHGRMPTGGHRHFCPEWDYMAIDDTVMEFEVCLCEIPGETRRD